MITVPDGTKKIIERSRYLSEALSKKLINHTALAKYIQPELERLLVKDVSVASIVMAIRRLEGQLGSKNARSIIFPQTPEILVRSGLSLVFLRRTAKSEELVQKLFIRRVKGSYHSIIIGSSEIAIALSNNILNSTLSKIPGDALSSTLNNCALVTIYLSEGVGKNPGIYYFFLKSLAWEEINTLLCTSTSNEFTLFFEEKEVYRAHEIIASLFEKKVLEK